MRDIVMIRATSAAALQQVLDRAVRLLEQRQPDGQRDLFVDQEGGVALVQVERADVPVRVPMHRGQREAFAYRGFVGAKDPAAEQVRALVELRDQPGGKPALRLTSSPGGIAAFFLADGRGSRCIAWSGLAGVEGIFHTSARDVTVVSSSPLLSHLLATGRDTPEPSLSWGRRILIGDSTLWDDTPYEGTFYAQPRSTLLVDAGGVHTLPHPLEIGARWPDLSQEGLDELADAALKSIEVVRGFGPLTLQLSGGKDSRLVAALAARAGLDVECLTYASGQSGEPEAAAQIARFLNLPHRVAVQEVSSGEALLPTMLANLRRSEGLLNENRQLAYELDPSQTGRPLLQGQAHHPRGGYRAVVKTSLEKARQRLYGQMTGDAALVRQDILVERTRRIDELLDGYPIDHPADWAYWMYADWRAARWLQSAYAAIWTQRPLHWPMMDERVLQVCARLSAWERASEHAYFATLERLAPGIGRIPLYADVWKFDGRGPEHSLFPEGYAERNQPVQDPPGQRSQTLEKRMSTVLPLFRELVHDARCAAELRSWIRPDALALLLEGPDGAAALGLDQQRVVRFMWKAAAIALVLDGRHLAAEDRAPSTAIGDARRRVPCPADLLPARDSLDLSGAEAFAIGQTVLKGGFESYEPEVFAMMGALIESAEAPVRLLDIGANVGVFSLVMASIFGDSLSVTAFEPMPELAAFVRGAAERSGVAVDVREIALGAEDGRASFYVSSRSDASSSLNSRFREHASVLEVDVRKLDSVVPPAERAGSFVVKLDTESTEPDVLEGARELIAEKRPAIICEVLAGRTEERLARFFGELGYVSIHITDAPNWAGSESLAGDPSHTHRDWLFLPAPASERLRGSFARWFAAYAQLKRVRELEAAVATSAAQVQRLEWKLARRNERVRELEADHRLAGQQLADARRSLGEAVNRARQSDAKLEKYRKALINARGSVGFRLGRATTVALRGSPLELPRRWLNAFNGPDEILAKLEGEPAAAARLVRPDKPARAGFWSSPGVVRFRKGTQRTLQALVPRSKKARASTGGQAPDVTQQWLHIVNQAPPGTAPRRGRFELPVADELPPDVDPAVFEATWRRLCETRAGAALIGELVGKTTDDLDDALRALLPALAGKRLVDEPVAPVPNLEVQLPNFGSYALPTPIDWTADGRGVRDWRFWLQNLGWLDRLRGRYGLAAAAYVVVDWAERVLPAEPPLEMTWEEHSVGVRLARVWRFLQAYVESGRVLNRRIVHAAVQIVLTHIYALTLKEVYAAEHNHGLMQDQSLLTHVAQLPALRDHDRLFRLAEFRILQLQVGRSVTSDAVHHENSPHYHILFAKVLATLLNEAYAAHGKKPPEVLLQVRDALLESFLYMLQPDLTVPQFGDSVNESRLPELSFVLEQTQKSFPLPPGLLARIQYVLSDGREGQVPLEVDRVFMEGGYACFRQHWSAGSASKVITAHFRCSRHSNVHYHQDETSFEIYGYGQKLIAESGRYNNDKGSALHDYQRSTQAHNVLTVDGAGFGRFKRRSRIVAHRVGRYLSWVQGSHDYYSSLGIAELVRTFVYSKYNFFVVLDSLRAKDAHHYEQHFHLHPSLTKLSFPTPDTVVASTERGGPTVVLTAGTRPELVRTVRGKDPATGEQSWYFPNENVAEPATDVIFRYRREPGRVHLPLFITLFASEDGVDLFPIEHEISDRELAVAIERLRYARHIVVPLYESRPDAAPEKAARPVSPAERALSARLARSA